jgi:hypothetical protein
MVEHIVEPSGPRGRVDIQVGAGRRRRWSDEAKGRIVAASYAPGAVVSEEVPPMAPPPWQPVPPPTPTTP